MKTVSVVSSSSLQSSSPWRVNQTSNASKSSTAGGSARSATNTSNDDAAIDAKAQSILEAYASSSAATGPDESLGSYVTSILRQQGNLQQKTDLELQELVSSSSDLLELLEDHCSLTSENARKALLEIVRVLRDGVALASPLTSVQDLLGVLPPGQTKQQPVTDEKTKGHQLHVTVENPTASQVSGADLNPISPLHEDNLLPVDLWGALDENDSPIRTSPRAPQEAKIAADTRVEDDPFPPLGATSSISSKKKKSKRPLYATGEDSGNAQYTASSQQNTVTSTMDTPTPKESMHPEASMDYYYYSFQAIVDALLNNNPELSAEAAMAAASYQDLEFAQYLIDAAFSAPPICRHLLAEGCYRSDCQFSHDVEGNSCIFWLRGRCGKGDSCRFRHGFDERLVKEYYGPTNDNAVQEENTTYPPLSSTGSTFGTTDPSHYAIHNAMGAAVSWDTQSGSERNLVYSTTATEPATSSFANVASKGYTPSQSFATNSSSNATSSLEQSIPTAKIPLDVWTPHETRDASVFYIVDPFERYHAVSSSVKRSDVIDLHFQSTKTFPAILSSVLPEKLSRMDEVWIVTGTGHHVGSKTHQKGGGALERAVIDWLTQEEYRFCRGRDRNGQGGAILVRNL